MANDTHTDAVEIMYALLKFDGDKGLAAMSLGICRRTLYRKMEAFDSMMEQERNERKLLYPYAPTPERAKLYNLKIINR